MWEKDALPEDYRFSALSIKRILCREEDHFLYLLHDKHSNRLFYLKEYFPQDAKRAKYYSVAAHNAASFRLGLRLFIEEINLQAKIKHPHILPILSRFVANNTVYAAMPYIEGVSLQHLIAQGQTAEPDELRVFLPPLLDALDTIHQHGFLHKNLQPSSIYIRHQDNLPILTALKNRYTMQLSVYFPLEYYATDTASKGVWTDIYALSAILYHLVTGISPVETAQRIYAYTNNLPDPLVSAQKLAVKKFNRHFLASVDWGLNLLEQKRPQNLSVWRTKMLNGLSAKKWLGIF
jgi:serine/threonine protein kinase